MDFDKAYKIIWLCLLSIIVVLMLIILPVAFQEKDLYAKCDLKVLCEKHIINKKLCVNYNYSVENISFNISFSNR
jgi:hypothetical protein